MFPPVAEQEDRQHQRLASKFDSKGATKDTQKLIEEGKSDTNHHQNGSVSLHSTESLQTIRTHNNGLPCSPGNI